MNNFGCHWAKSRLPLLAGGELTGYERRRLERHVISCPSCRRQLASARVALQALHVTAGVDSADEGRTSASLWPALARQIRESRHEPKAPWWSPSVGEGLQARAWVWPALGVAAGALAAFYLPDARLRQAGTVPPAVVRHVPSPTQFSPIHQAAPTPKPAPPPAPASGRELAARPKEASSSTETASTAAKVDEVAERTPHPASPEPRERDREAQQATK